jgi:Tol biopolymer transport system component
MMKKLFFLVCIGFSVLTTAQTRYQLLIEGTPEDAVMNPAYSPDGLKVAYTKAGYQGIWVLDFQTLTNKQITNETAAGFGYKWSSDSKSILTRVAKYEDLKRYNAVKVFSIETRESKQLSDYKTMMPYLPEWTDGDSKVYLPLKGSDEVYVSGIGKNNIITNDVITFEKNNKITVLDFISNSESSLEPIKDAQYINLSLSPDKLKMVFEVMGGNMFVVNTDGSNLTDLGKGNRPKWSLDSKKIIYMIAEDNGHEFTASDIYIINADGTDRVNITNTDDVIEMSPGFSPDGKSIVFENYLEGSIYLMNIE